jgi:hypothetical protein
VLLRVRYSQADISNISAVIVVYFTEKNNYHGTIHMCFLSNLMVADIKIKGRKLTWQILYKLQTLLHLLHQT